MQVYLSTLEATKSWSLEAAARVAPSEAATAGLSNFFAGAVASLVTQSVIVPIDVVSQRLMVAGMNFFKDLSSMQAQCTVILVHARLQKSTATSYSSCFT